MLAALLVLVLTVRGGFGCSLSALVLICRTAGTLEGGAMGWSPLGWGWHACCAEVGLQEGMRRSGVMTVAVETGACLLYDYHRFAVQNSHANLEAGLEIFKLMFQLYSANWNSK